MSVIKRWDAVAGEWIITSNGVMGYTGSQGIGYTGSQGIGYTGSASTIIGYTGSKGDVGYTGSAGSLGYTPLNKAGDTATGIITAYSNVSYETKQIRNIIVSTADAILANMENGDIWIKV